MDEEESLLEPSEFKKRENIPPLFDASSAACFFEPNFSASSCSLVFRANSASRLSIACPGAGVYPTAFADMSSASEAARAAGLSSQAAFVFMKLNLGACLSDLVGPNDSLKSREPPFPPIK